MLSKTLKKILSTQVMTGRELTLMIFLAGLMKWRIPKADVFFEGDSMGLVLQEIHQNLHLPMGTTVQGLVVKSIM